MRFSGKVYKDGTFWLAEVSIFDALTQARTKKKALAMIADWFVSMVNKPDFSVTVHSGKHGTFEVESEDIPAMTSLLLKRQRHVSGISLAEAASRLGAKSRNTYARYEQGKAVPTVEQFYKLLKAVSPSQEFVLQPSTLHEFTRN
jgi:DNA-binding XRE family transcriptional regulator